MANENLGAGPGILGHPDRIINYAPDTGDGGGQPEIPDWIKAMGLEYVQGGKNLFEPQIADQFVDSVKNLSRLKARLYADKNKNGGKEQKKLEEEIRRERERIKELREEIFYDQIGLVDGIHEEMLGFESPYPYESRPGANFIKALEEKLTKELALKRRERLEEESILLLKEMREAILWTKGTYHILEGLGSAMKAYYDGELQQEALYSMFKRIVGGDWKKAYAKEIKGASLDDGEKQRLAELGYLDRDKKETLRDEAIRYSDDQMFWTMAIASAGQWDYNSANQSERLMNLSGRELKFIQKLFGVVGDKTPLECTVDDFIEFKGKRIPKTIFSWFAMENASDDNLNVMEVMMQVILERDIKGRFERGEDMDSLVSEVKNEAKLRLEKIEAPKTMRERLSFAVFNQNLIVINGLMASGDVGWRFDYEKVMDSQGGEHLKRKLELGSIYTAFDVATVYYWMLHKVIYDARAEDRSTLMLPSVGEFRKMFDSAPPDFKLDIDQYCNMVGDHKMLRMLELLEGDDLDAFGKGKSLKNTELRQSGESFGQLNEDFLRFLKRNISAFMVPFYEEKVKDPNDPTGNKEKPVWLVLPVPIPPVMDILNFFRAVGWTRDGKKSFYVQMLERSKKMSTLEWGKITRQAFDSWRVTSAQAHKWTVYLIGTHELKREIEESFKVHFAQARGVALKNLDKRGRLGTRMDEQKRGVWNLAFVPFLIALSSAKVTGVIGMGLESPPKDTAHAELVQFRRRIGNWINVALDMPSDAYGLKNFNGTMAFMIFWYGAILERIALAAEKNYGTNSSDISGKTETLLKKYH